MSIKQLRTREQKALDRFLVTCQELLDIDAELLEIHNQLDHAGEQSKGIFEKSVLIAEARNIVRREQYRQREIAEDKRRKEMAAQGRDEAGKVRGKTHGRTFGLKLNKKRRK
jgi:hypothetical protein